jgi:ABC-type transport system involved in multi-copper enzyme maturation permease subunit
MLGPIFSLELRLAVRRGRLNTFRCIYGGWWVVQFMGLCLILSQAETNPASPGAGPGPFIHLCFQIFVAQHFIFLVLATPAFVAGAITDEKSQGTLQHLLTADLTAWEIVLGKFLGRMAQVILMALVGWPFICFLAGYGHFSLPALLATALVTGLAFFVLGAASVWASVRSKQTREAVLRVYAWSALAFLIVWGGLEGITDRCAKNLRTTDCHSQPFPDRCVEKVKFFAQLSVITLFGATGPTRWCTSGCRR